MKKRGMVEQNHQEEEVRKQDVFGEAVQEIHQECPSHQQKLGEEQPQSKMVR